METSSVVSAVNVWAVLAAAVSAFVLGGLWYSPVAFGKAWMRETGLSEEELARGNPAMIFGTSFVLALIAAAVFAAFLGPAPPFGFAAAAGLAAGVAWVASSFGINYLFERKSLRLFLINAGYHVVQFTLIGAILGLWH
jgi:hypothetical protein